MLFYMITFFYYIFTFPYSLQNVISEFKKQSQIYSVNVYVKTVFSDGVP